MIRKLQSQILKSIKSKRLNVFLLFLLSSFIILLFTKLSKQYTHTISFNISKVNVPQDKVILNDSNSSLNITLRTHGFKWLEYYLNQPQLEIDFSKDVYKKGNTYVWTKPLILINNLKQFDGQLEVLGVVPDTIHYRYDTNMVKKVPVVVNTNFNFAPGFDVSEAFKITPDSIVVVGPHELVMTLDSLSTEALILKDVKSDVSQKVKLLLPEEGKDLKFSKKEVKLFAKVERFTEGTVKVPIAINNLPDSLKLKFFPKSVDVSYYTSLDNFKNISSKDFKVMCNFDKVLGKQSFLIPKLVEFPLGVKHVKVNQQRIEYIILE